MSQSARQGVSVGMVLAETYEVTKLLGEGGMGSVWEAQHRRLQGKKVAIKVLHSFVAGDSESVERFNREAQIASRLGHPNIVHVEDFNALPNGTWYLVLEYLKGEDLNERLKRGPLPLPHALAIARQIASALQAAHSEGIVHRDLKPHNVFLCPSESHGYATELVKVLDFGISKIQGSDTVKTQTNAILGTPQYMSPEQARGAHREIDHRTDVFALGAIVYEMLAGRPAFLGESIPEVMFKVVYEEPPPLGELVPSLPPKVIAAVTHALAKSRDQRCESASAFIEELTGDPLITLRGGPATAHLASPGLSPSLAAMAASKNQGASMGRAASPEAFAVTMPPGAGGQTALDPLAATMPPPGAAGGHGFAASTAPQLGNGSGTHVSFADGTGTGGPGMAAAAVNLPGQSHGNLAYTSPDVERPRHAGRRVLPYVLGVAAMIATFAVVLALRPDRTSDDAPTDTPAVATGPAPGTDTTALAPGTDQPAQPAGTAGGASIDAGAGKVEPGAAAGTDQPGDAPRPDRPRDPDRRPQAGDEEEDEAAIPGELKQQLEEAEGMLSKDPDGAIRRAKKVLGSKPGNQRAIEILTKAYCIKRDVEGVPIYLQQARRAKRAKLKKFCRDQGYTNALD